MSDSASPAVAHAATVLAADVVVRRATEADVATIVEFQLAMALETEGLALDRAVVTRGVSRPFATPNLADYYVATLPPAAPAHHGVVKIAAAGADSPAVACASDLDSDGRVVVGSLMITFEWSDWRAGSMWWLESVYVVPACRRGGVFTAMYRYVEGRMRADPDAAGLRLYVEEDNVRAQGAYRRLGMELEHYKMMKATKGAF